MYRLFLSPAPLRHLIYTARLSSTTTTTTTTTITPISSSAVLPRIAQPSLWANLIPKPFRRSPSSPNKSKWFRTFWANPATPILLLSLLVGSQAIQTLTLKNEMLAYDRRSEGKILVLREVIRRVQDGEEVDVEGILGAGDRKSEEEWFDVIKEIEEEERIISRKMRRKRRENADNEEALTAPDQVEKGNVADMTHEGRRRPKGPMFM